MKIDLTPVTGFEETKPAGWIEPHHCPDRLAFVVLDLALQTASVILQPSASTLEGVVDGKGKIGMPFVCLGGARDIDLATVRKCEPDIDLIDPARVVMSARSFHHYPAGGYPAEALL